MIESALDPELPIIDPHVHLWMRDDESFLLDDYMAGVGGHDVQGIVALECASSYRTEGPELLKVIGETEFVNRLCPVDRPGCALKAIVGTADLSKGDAVAPVLIAQIEAGQGRFRGIRKITAWDAEPRIHLLPPTVPGMMDDAGFRAGFAHLAPLELSFDAWLYHHQLSELTKLADDFPDTAIILNHMGGPLSAGSYATQRKSVFEVWRRAIVELAERPNVVIKLGGMGMRVTSLGFDGMPEPVGSAILAEAWRPYTETCIGAFGPERCMFESNFPVDRQTCSFVTLWNAFKRIAAGCSSDERTALFSGTAACAYKISMPSAAMENSEVAGGSFVH